MSEAPFHSASYAEIEENNLLQQFGGYQINIMGFSGHIATLNRTALTNIWPKLGTRSTIARPLRQAGKYSVRITPRLTSANPEVLSSYCC